MMRLSWVPVQVVEWQLISCQSRIKSLLLLEAGPDYDPAKNVTQLKTPGNRHDEVPVPNSDRLVILMPAIGAGKLMANHIPKQLEPNGTGGVQGCWVEEPIIGEGFHCALDQKILKEKVLMVWVMTGRSAMMM